MVRGCRLHVRVATTSYDEGYACRRLLLLRFLSIVLPNLGKMVCLNE